MKRFGEKAIRTALTNGATIRYNDHFTADAGYRVRINGETEGYITSDLFSKLLHDNTIEKIDYGFSYREYGATTPAAEEEEEEFETFYNAFSDSPVSYDVCREIYYNTLCDDGKTVDKERAARNIREYAETIRAEQEQEQEPVYISESAPTSNSIPNVYYALTIKTGNGEYTRHIYTVDDLETFVSGIRRTGETITSAYRVNTETGEQIPFIPETRQEKTDRENREHCKYIADEVEAYAAGNVYRCPECGETITVEELEEITTETEDGETLYRLPCGCSTDIEPEQCSLYDYFENVLDIEYRIESDRKTLRSVSLMVAYGGPTIYIDTAENAVMLYWWTDRARYSFDSWLGEEINEWAEELWSC